MQLSHFKIFVKDIVKEARRLQKHDLTGRLLTKRKYSDGEIISFVCGIVGVIILRTGFTDNFAGYTISFLGIFVGLFTTIIISLYDKKNNIITNYAEQHQIDKTRTLKIRNYLIQFTGLVSYSILLALLVIGLLFLVLLSEQSRTNIFTYTFINSTKEINTHTIWLFCKGTIIIVHRFFVVYLLTAFFTNTIYAVSSYFSFLLSEHKKTDLKKEQAA